MCSKEAAIEWGLWALLYTLHYPWAEPNEQLPFPEENVWVTLSGKMNVCCRPPTFHRGEGNISQLRGNMSGRILNIAGLSKQHHFCPLLGLCLDGMVCSHQFHIIINCVFSLKLACTARQISQNDKARVTVGEADVKASISDLNLLVFCRGWSPGDLLVTDLLLQVTGTSRGRFCGWKDITYTMSIHGQFLLCLQWQTQGHGTVCNQHEHPGKEAWIKAWWPSRHLQPLTL